MSIKGLYYYKLSSPYSDDITKNCKLTVNEIDSNFLNLKHVDVKSFELRDDDLVITRNNGDELIVDLTPILSGSVYDLEVDVFNPTSGCEGMDVYVKYDIVDEDGNKVTKTVPIKGIVTKDNIDDVLGGGLLKKVVSDGTLDGNGTLASPLGIAKTELNRPAVKLIKITSGETLPETHTEGTRYITEEFVSEFGMLYNYEAVENIAADLAEKSNGWRIPTKADWDCLLNSIEPCEYRNHDNGNCHICLGKYAGSKLKSACGWEGEPDCECKNTRPLVGRTCEGDVSGLTEEDDEYVDDSSAVTEVTADYVGTDDFGMKILPTGYGDVERHTPYFKEKTIFWTSTHVYNDIGQDVYVKEFDWDKSCVIQEALCPDMYLSLRLVKDFDGENHFPTETILDNNYNTILFEDCGTIWTASNFGSDKYKTSKDGKRVTGININNGYNPYGRIVYFVNVWDGKEWKKRQLVEGESITIMEGNPTCQYNVDYRVYSDDGCNQVLVNADDAIVERVLDELMPLLDDEREARISGDTELWKALSAETSARTEADSALTDALVELEETLTSAITAERTRAISAETEIRDELNAEIERATTEDQELWETIDSISGSVSEISSSITILEQEIEEERNERISADTAIYKDIDCLEDRLLKSQDVTFYARRRGQNEPSLTLDSSGKTEECRTIIKIRFDADFGTF